MENTKKTKTLNDALVFWKDALRKYWHALNNPGATEREKLSSEAYYKAASEHLRKAWE